MSAPAYLPLFGSDYLADTRHLTTEEHGAYLLLMMAAWRQDDCGLPLDDKKLARIVGLTVRKWDAIKGTILEFWSVENGRIYQGRLRKEHTFVLQKSESNRKSAITRWDKQRVENIEATPCERISKRICEGNAPYTHTHTEEVILAANAPNITARTRKRAAGNSGIPERPDDVAEQVWADFLAMRQKMRADVSKTVIAGFRREADRVGWTLEKAISESVMRNWRGFKAEWVNDNDRSANGTTAHRNGNGQSPDRRSTLARVIDEGIDNLEWMQRSGS